VKQRADNFRNNEIESGLGSLVQRKLIPQIWAIFESHTGGFAWKATVDSHLKRCYLSMEDHNWKIVTMEQRTDVGKYLFVNPTIKIPNQLPAGLLTSFHCKLNTFRKRVRNVVTSKGLQVSVLL
jgi:hypothetical protein